MLTYVPAKPEQYEEFLQLLREEMKAYLERTIEIMKISWEEFEKLFFTRGRVLGIYEDGHLAGFYWVEERDNVLHIHALVLREGFRGRGIGTEVLRRLEAQHGASVSAFELGVHESNLRARALYEREGYRTVETLAHLGFTIMQKAIRPPAAGDAPKA